MRLLDQAKLKDFFIILCDDVSIQYLGGYVTGKDLTSKNKLLVCMLRNLPIGAVKSIYISCLLHYYHNFAYLFNKTKQQISLL
jgi:hypothetical protein